MLIGSLFSGIGGLELGLEWSGLGHTAWQVEIDAGCREVLAQHWPDATRYEDVKQVGSSNLGRVDVLCGGFPCTDVSSAGKRAGITGPQSGLWFEYLRIVSELRPKWVVVENVASGASKWVDTVLTGLGEQGYACLPIPLSAADVGAPHIRPRVFVVACDANSDREPVGAQHEKVARLPRAATTLPWSGLPHIRVDDGIPSRMGQLGNSVVPQCAEVVGHVIRELCSPT